MVLAYHIIFTAYGFWLPNDPRGSWSDFVWSWELACYGGATKTSSRGSRAGADHNRELREASKVALLRPPVAWNDEQIEAIADGFADAKAAGRYDVRACSILPEHVHIVVLRHPERSIETIANHMKSRATTFLAQRNMHPFQDETGPRGGRPSPWSESFWQVYLSSQEAIAKAREYVRDNPTKENRPAQKWGRVNA